MIDQPHAPKTRQANRMPVDKQQNGKPFTPSLSSNFRSTKSPLTPRLAGSGPNTPSSGQRREAFVRARSPGKEEAPTPLAVNITPRSAARKSRIGTESPSTTPTSRPAVASPAQNAPTPQVLGIASPLARVETTLSEVATNVQSPTPLYPGPRRASGARSAVQTQEGDSKFFRADDARPLQLQQPPKASVDSDPQFFYISGTSNIASPKVSPGKLVNPVSDEKFFLASEARSQQQKPVRPELQTRKTAGSIVSTRSGQQTSTAAFVRSPSPGKNAQARPISRGKDAAPRPRSGVFAIASPDERRSSIGSGISILKDNQPSHKKSMSANSVTTTPTRKLSAPRPIIIPTLEERLNASINSAESLPIPTASPGSISPRSVSLGSQISDRSLTTARLNSSSGDPSTNPSSTSTSSASETKGVPTLPPTSPPLPPTANSNDPAVQARRERKVLDLEISNSSLLAINKTLERELRKQNVELRRFRRLSRSGRLSFAPNGARNISNSTLGTLPELDDDDEFQLSGSGSDDEGDLDGDDDSLSLLSDDAAAAGVEGVLSPGTARARQRARDEKRLMLDLSKHQQMLLDSQKLSLSIRRCLTCTEELIKDGNRALEYRADVGNVGGRVLNHDFDDVRPDTNDGEQGVGVHGVLGISGGGTGAGGGGQARQGLLSPSVEIGDWLSGGLWVSQGRGDADHQSRDEAPQQRTSGHTSSPEAVETLAVDRTIASGRP